ncbi:MAG: hypothetical protein ACLS3S_06850 [Streptococcus salivarius]
MKWFDQFSILPRQGLHVGSPFAHIVINWFGPISKSFDGFFRTAPVYDTSHVSLLNDFSINT